MNKKGNGLRTWVEIDRKAIASNFRMLRKCISKKTKFMAVVKSNAYGHDMVPFAKEMVKLGTDWIGVDSIEEAYELRKNKIKKPILVLGLTLPEHFLNAGKQNISITISNFESLKKVLSLGKKSPKFHIKVDTGLHRQGFLGSDLPKIISIFGQLNVKGQLSNVPKPEGLYTHFAAAESISSNNYTFKQIDNFKKWVKAFDDIGISVIKHTSGTAGTMVCPESHFDLVRVGIGLYGLWPSEETKKVAEKKIKLVPVLSWKSILGDVKDIPMGSLVGYDCTEAVRKDSKIAVIPVGYWQGMPRSFSSTGSVLVKGQRSKVLGRVSMDMLAVDITGIKGVKTGDTAVLIGKMGKAVVSAEDVANRAGTINYEIVTRINPNIERIYK